MTLIFGQFSVDIRLIQLPCVLTGGRNSAAGRLTFILSMFIVSVPFDNIVV